MSDDLPTVQVVSLKQRTVTLGCGRVLPIRVFMDEAGDYCEAIDAASCIAGTEAYGWLDIQILPQETVH